MNEVKEMIKELDTLNTAGISDTSGIRIDKTLWERWTKYGKDRLYLRNESLYEQDSAYIDIKTREAVGFENNDMLQYKEAEDRIVVVSHIDEPRIIAFIQK